MSNNKDESVALTVVKQVVDKAVSGNPTLKISSAKDLALQYINDKSYRNNDERIDAMIKWESAKNFGSGFITGIGGVVTLPVSLPTSLVSTWLIQARLCAAVAYICGYDTDDEKVQIAVLLTILGNTGKEVLKEMGEHVGKEVTMQLIKNFTPKVIRELNKRIGFKLITNAGQKSLLSQMGKFVPVVGGAISGSIDAVACQTIGRTAKIVFTK